MKEEEKNRDLTIYVYASTHEISVSSENGSCEHTKMFYAEVGDHIEGTFGEKEFAEDLFFLSSRLEKEVGNCNDLLLRYNYRGIRKQIVCAVDGYFGRPEVVSQITVLRCLNNREIKRLESLVHTLQKENKESKLIA